MDLVEQLVQDLKENISLLIGLRTMLLANGDGDFDSADLVYVFQKGEYGNDHDVVDAAFAE